MPHASAPLTELGRLRLARCVVDDGWPLRRAAERFQVSVTTATRWAARYRQHGPDGPDSSPEGPRLPPQSHAYFTRCAERAPTPSAEHKIFMINICCGPLPSWPCRFDPGHPLPKPSSGHREALAALA